MPVEEKSLKANVTFALAIVKANVISDRAESSRIQAALQVMFPGVSVILVAEGDEPTSHRSCQELTDFTNVAPCRVIASSKIASN